MGQVAQTGDPCFEPRRSGERNCNRCYPDDARDDVRAFMTLPKAQRTQCASTSLEHVNAEMKRRTGVVGIVPNDAEIVRLVRALFVEQNDESPLQRRYMQLEGLQSVSGNQLHRISAVVAAPN